MSGTSGADEIAKLVEAHGSQTYVYFNQFD